MIQENTAPVGQGKEDRQYPAGISHIISLTSHEARRIYHREIRHRASRRRPGSDRERRKAFPYQNLPTHIWRNVGRNPDLLRATPGFYRAPATRLGGREWEDHTLLVESYRLHHQVVALPRNLHHLRPVHCNRVLARKEAPEQWKNSAGLPQMARQQVTACPGRPQICLPTASGLHDVPTRLLRHECDATPARVRPFAPAHIRRPTGQYQGRLGPGKSTAPGTSAAAAAATGGWYRRPSSTAPDSDSQPYRLEQQPVPPLNSLVSFAFFPSYACHVGEGHSRMTLDF